MSTTMSGNRGCDHVLDLLDSYMDGEVSPEDQREIADHLEACSACFGEHQRRRTIRDRLRGAVRSVSASPDVQTAIQQSIRSNRRSARSFYTYRATLAVAAAIVLFLTAAIAYQRGYLRLTRGSQDSYLATISAPIAGVMRVGLGDHVHCAVFQAFPNRHPTFEQMGHDMGQYKDLTPLIREKIPGDYRVVMAHQCRYRGRRFVHVTLASKTALVSLVISRRNEGESFEKDALIPVVTESGIPIYQVQTQRFEISGFATRDHLIYIVSNLPQQDNLRMMLALAPTVKSFLRSLES